MTNEQINKLAAEALGTCGRYANHKTHADFCGDKIVRVRLED